MNLKVMANYNKTSLNTILITYKDIYVCVCVMTQIMQTLT
jgi:hypothetical protein